MVDPLSIAASSAALAQLCIKIASFVADAKSVEESIQSLHQQLSGLSRTLISVTLAWNSNPEVAAAQNGPDGTLWICIKDNITDCTASLEKFQRLLKRVSNENGGGGISILRRSVSKLKLNMSASEMNGLRMEIESYHRAVDIGLQAINACVMLRNDRADAKMSKRLDQIEIGIQGLTQNIRRRKDLLPPSNSKGTENLEKFVEAANTFQSRASSFASGGERTVTGENGTQLGSSVFGEPLSEERVSHIENWIRSPTDESSIDSETVVSSALGWNEVESLPQLMSVLENVTQMADRFQAIEKQKSLTREEEIRSLTTRRLKLEEQLQTTTEAFKCADKEVTDLRVKILTVLDEAEALKTEKDKLSKKQKGIKSQNSSLRTNIDEAMKYLGEFKENKKLFLAQQNNWKQVHQQFEEQMKANTSALTERTEMLSTAQAKVDSLELDCKSLTAEKDSLKEKLDSQTKLLTSKISHFEALNEDLSEEIVILSQEKKDLATSILEKNKRIDDVTEEAKKLREKNHSLTGQLNGVLEEYEKNNALYLAKKGVITSLQNKNADLESLLKSFQEWHDQAVKSIQDEKKALVEKHESLIGKFQDLLKTA